MKTQRLLILLVLLCLSVVFFSTMSYLEKKSREEFLIKATEKSQAKLCLNGTQSQRARYCPEMIRESTSTIFELRQLCANNESAKTAVKYFDGRDYTCTNTADLELKHAQFITAIRR